jgi:hypothetical protein
MELVAAISSDPRDFAELEMAWQRYHERESLDKYLWQEAKDELPSEAWIVINLSRLQVVMSERGVGPAEGRGCYTDDGGRVTSGNPGVWFNPPPTWKVLWHEDDPQQEFAEYLTPAAEVELPLDYRSVLFGRAMTDDLAQRMLALAKSNEFPQRFLSEEHHSGPLSDSDQLVAAAWTKLTRQVHRAWLLTRREDLRGKTPREFLHRGRTWVDREVEGRIEQWTMTNRQPAGLSQDSYSYRYGPMGLAQVVSYFDYCREALWQGWRLLSRERNMTADRLSERMFAFGQAWLRRIPPQMMSSLTTADRIERDRRHLPVASHGGPIDCDCPLCRMMADETADALGFSMVDGYLLEMEDDFAFSTYTTRREWEEERYVWDEAVAAGDCMQDDFDEDGEDYCDQEDDCDEDGEQEFCDDDEDDFDLCAANQDAADQDAADQDAADQDAADQDEEELEDIEDDLPLAASPEFRSLWSCHVPGSTPLPVSLMSMAFHATELVGDLKRLTAPQDEIDRFNQVFDGFRRAAALGMPRKEAIMPLKQALERMANLHPELIGKAADMQSELDEWARKVVPSGF